MKILFWNTNRNQDINMYLASLVMDYNIDILITAEYAADKNELHNIFRKSNQYLNECNTFGCKRINFWSNYVEVEASVQSDHYSIQIVKDKYILCCVHLMSDLHGDSSYERLKIAEQIMYDIHDIEEKIDSKRSIIIGDFNEMPYGSACLNANGFHGLPVLREKDKNSRIVNNKEYQKFYNPMWNLFGDYTYPPGTYYFNQAKLHSPMWYMLDQVIISQELLPLFSKESLKIITTCSYGDLMDDSYHPNKRISDHFPIMCEIRNV